MTNLSSYKKKKEIINPENALLFTPVILGCIILAVLIAFVYRPLSQKLNNENAKIKVLEEKITFIPLYQKYINELSFNTNNAKRQQERLIELISDPQELETILSEINRISNENNIEIIDVVPKPIIKFGKSKDEDPFLINSIEKHIFKLRLKGDFNSLLDFLKQLELLQTIVISDEIEIKSNPTNSNKDRLKLIMTFNLSTYARIKTDKVRVNNKK